MTLQKYKRACDGCTKCCEGWLHATIHGHQMGRGRKCFFVAEGGCSIYEDRPDIPCKSFKCAWLVDSRIPEWFKPSMSNVIGHWKRTIDNKFDYLEVMECENKIDSSVLNWLFEFHTKENVNIVYTINNQLYYMGPEDFCNSMENKVVHSNNDQFVYGV